MRNTNGRLTIHVPPAGRGEKFLSFTKMSLPALKLTQNPDSVDIGVFFSLKQSGRSMKLLAYLNPKAFPLEAWTGPEGSRRLRLADFKTVGT